LEKSRGLRRRDYGDHIHLYGCKGYFKRSLYLFERAGLAAGLLLFAPGWTTTLIVLAFAPPWIYLNWYRMKSHGLDTNAGGFVMPPWA